MIAEFDEYASEYSTLLRDPIRDRFVSDPAFFHQRKWDIIRAFLKHRHILAADQAWLDVGCGKGELLSLGHGTFARAVGCDPSRRMTTLSTSVEIRQQTSPTQLPYPDESVDLVTAVCVYHHVRDDERAPLTEAIHRVLKPNGVFCMIEHNPWNPATRVIVRRCPVDAAAQLMTASNARTVVRQAGLTVLDTKYFLYLPESVFRRFPWVEHALCNAPLGGQFAVFCRK